MTQTAIWNNSQNSNIGKISPVVENENPSPLDFDEFVPWACSQWQTSTTIKVARLIQEDLIKYEKKKPSRAPTVRLKTEDGDDHPMKSTVQYTENFDGRNNTILIKAYYDHRGKVVEVSIDAPSVVIHRKLIQAFSICFPFQPLLTKLSIRRGLKDYIIYDIGKLLPLTNITDLCFDDTFVPEGNYYVLLDYVSQLKHLSLSRCKINDNIVEKLTERMINGHPGSKCLQTLNLSSNFITDLGSFPLANMLRKNRSLIYLNLASNRVSDVGAFLILDTMKSFPLTYEEIMITKRGRIDYIKSKEEVYRKCLQDIVARQQGVKDDVINTSLLSSKHTGNTAAKEEKQKKCRPKSLADSTLESPSELARSMVSELVDKFDDPFDYEHTFKDKCGYVHCIGNLKLSYLNLSYNSLEYPAVVKLLNVIKYQSSLLQKPLNCTGLLKVLLDGNNLPINCPELDHIGSLLNSLSSHRGSAIAKSRVASGGKATSRVSGFRSASHI